MSSTLVVAENRKSQLMLFDTTPELGDKGKSGFRDPAFGNNKGLPVHRWVPWIAGFSSDFVREAIQQRLRRQGVVLDPFAGVGTTLVEAQIAGHQGLGFEINPYAALACRTKLSAFQVSSDDFETQKSRFWSFYRSNLETSSQAKSTPPPGFKTRGTFYSPQVLKKVLVIQDFIKGIPNGDIRDLFRLAFGSTMIIYSNYGYGPSLGQKRSLGQSDIEDFAVGEIVLSKLTEMGADIRLLQLRGPVRRPMARIWQESFFKCKQHIRARTVDLLITSPPYLNNYHYNRNTRPHLYWLGYVEKPQDMKALEQENFGKFWQTVRAGKRIHLEFELEDTDLREQLETLARLNRERGVYGGQGWANYAAAYFNDCYRFVECAKYVLRRKGRALVVIGNSILQGIMIPTDKYLAKIAESVGLELIDIHVPRATRVGNSIIQSDVRVGKAKDSHKLYEAVVELRKK